MPVLSPVRSPSGGSLQSLSTQVREHRACGSTGSVGDNPKVSSSVALALPLTPAQHHPLKSSLSATLAPTQPPSSCDGGSVCKSSRFADATGHGADHGPQPSSGGTHPDPRCRRHPPAGQVRTQARIATNIALSARTSVPRAAHSRSAMAHRMGSPQEGRVGLLQNMGNGSASCQHGS